jgi:drug/metabolite transporter (DMT)-like permease
MTQLRAHGLLILAACLWGLGNVAQKTVLTHVGPLMATGLTSLLAAFVLAPIMLRELRSTRTIPPLGETLLVSIVFMLALLTLQIGFSGTTVTNAGFLINTCIVMTPLAA